MRRQLFFVVWLSARAAPAGETAATEVEVRGEVAGAMERYQVAARSEQRGKFVAEWVRQPNGQGMIQRCFRLPIPPPQPPGRW